MRDILASSCDSSPVREEAISAMKSLLLRDKEDKFTAEFGGDEKVLSLTNSLIDADIKQKDNMLGGRFIITPQVFRRCPGIFMVLRPTALLLNFLKFLEA